MQLSRIRFEQRLRRLVFWGAVAVMLIAAPVGLVWRLLSREWGAGPSAALALGLGALLVALVFALLERMNPTFHPESHLFNWDDVDQLRQMARRAEDAEVREWARSLADRVAVVLPGRPHPPERRTYERIRDPERID